MNITWSSSPFEDLYSGDKYYIYKNKVSNKIHFTKVGEGAGGFTRIDKDDVPGEILDKISKNLI